MFRYLIEIHILYIWTLFLNDSFDAVLVVTFEQLQIHKYSMHVWCLDEHYCYASSNCLYLLQNIRMIYIGILNHRALKTYA